MLIDREVFQETLSSTLSDFGIEDETRFEKYLGDTLFSEEGRRAFAEAYFKGCGSDFDNTLMFVRYVLLSLVYICIAAKRLDEEQIGSFNNMEEMLGFVLHDFLSFVEHRNPEDFDVCFRGK